MHFLSICTDKHRFSHHTCKPSHPSKRLSSVTPSLLSTDNSLVSHVHLLPDGFIVSLFVSLPAPSGLGLQLTLTQQGQSPFWAGKCHTLPPLSLPPFIVTTLRCMYTTVVTHALVLHLPCTHHDIQRILVYGYHLSMYKRLLSPVWDAARS